LRDLNHPFDQRLETGRLPEDATQAGTVSASTATCRDAGRRLTGFDFEIRASGSSITRAVRQSEAQRSGDLNVAQHNALQ
jgi:hypothetical protein